MLPNQGHSNALNLSRGYLSIFEMTQLHQSLDWWEWSQGHVRFCRTVLYYSLPCASIQILSWDLSKQSQSMFSSWSGIEVWSNSEIQSLPVCMSWQSLDCHAAPNSGGPSNRRRNKAQDQAYLLSIAYSWQSRDCCNHFIWMLLCIRV